MVDCLSFAPEYRSASSLQNSRLGKNIQTPWQMWKSHESPVYSTWKVLQDYHLFHSQIKHLFFLPDKRKKRRGREGGKSLALPSVFFFCLSSEPLFILLLYRANNQPSSSGVFAQPFCALQSLLCLLRENWFLGMLCVHILIWALQPTPAEQVNQILGNGPLQLHSSLASYYSLIATCQTGKLSSWAKSKQAHVPTKS